MRCECAGKDEFDTLAYDVIQVGDVPLETTTLKASKSRACNVQLGWWCCEGDTIHEDHTVVMPSLEVLELPEEPPRCIVEQPKSSREVSKDLGRRRTVRNHRNTTLLAVDVEIESETSEGELPESDSTLKDDDEDVLDRDVVICEEYDEYDPQNGLTITKGLQGDVLRSRRKRFKRDVSEGTSSCTDSDTLSSQMSDFSLGRGVQDTVTNWAVLVGKARWCYMKGPGQKGQRERLGLISSAFNMGFGNVAERASQSSSNNRTTRYPTPAQSAGKASARRATAVVEQLKELVKRVGREETDMVDETWQEDALSFLFSVDYVDTLMILAGGARWALQSDETVVQASEPCVVFGDIHGQLRDLLLLFHAYGLPNKNKAAHFVFNGDFVDRGAHQLEVIGILFALKVAYPKNVWLVRGNHEDSSMNRKYGFADCCLAQMGSFGQKSFTLFQKAFDQLPLACLIEGKILTVHGGIGNGKWTIDELAAVKRPLHSEDFHTPQLRWLYNILWSDPIPEDAQEEQLFGVHSSPRTASAVQFGWNITKTFCALNGLDLLVRSHQCLERGSGFEVMHDQLLVRVFSARDYENHQNDAATLYISKSPDPEKRGQLIVRMRGMRSLVRED